MIINIFLHFCVIRTENKGENGQKSIVKIDKKKLTAKGNIEKMPETHCAVKKYMIIFYLYEQRW